MILDSTSFHRNIVYQDFRPLDKSTSKGRPLTKYPRGQLPVMASFDAFFIFYSRAILNGMIKKLNHWTYEGVINFLKDNGFAYFDEVPGVGKAWMNFHKNGEPDRIVEVKQIDGFYSRGAIKKMIRQSGITEQRWLE
jgi:hypothetical protein